MNFDTRDSSSERRSCGVGLSYAIVDADSLAVRPIADEVFGEVAGEVVPVVPRGPVLWCHQLARHSIALETAEPIADLARAAEFLQASAVELDSLLASANARLLPTAMHPWMAPASDAEPWNHAGSETIRAVDAAFDLRQHGWVNAQRARLELSFAGDDDFAALWAAVRLALPLAPALAASSPFVDGRRADAFDARLVADQNKTARVPSVAGAVIPEPASCRAEYEATSLAPLYRDVAPLDPDGLLRREWMSGRGAVPRWSRHTVEIRALDVQECPAADLAVAIASGAVVRALVEQRRLDRGRQAAWPTARLAALFRDTVRDGDAAVLADRDFVDAFGFPERGRCRARDLWQHLWEADVASEPGADHARPFFDLYVRRGCLARRLATAVDRRAAGSGDLREALDATYRDVADCLRTGTLFDDTPPTTAASLLAP